MDDIASGGGAVHIESLGFSVVCQRHCCRVSGTCQPVNTCKIL